MPPASAGRYTALSIVKFTFIVPLPVPSDLRITGFVRTITATQWTIGIGPAGSLAPDFLAQVNDQTKIVGNPKVGDRVEVIGALSSRGIIATSITKLP